MSDSTASAVIPFMFEGHEVRTKMIDGMPYFVAKDIADRLGYAKAGLAINQHCRGAAKYSPIIDSLGRSQKVRILSEPDVYRLIIGSQLPAAERFEAWVFEEVLPSIRKHGGYIVAAPEETPEELTLRAMKVLQAAVDRHKAQIVAMTPKVEGFDRLATATFGSVNMTEAAKVLQVLPRKLIKYMEQNDLVYRRAAGKNLVAYQRAIKAGLLEHKRHAVERPDGEDKVYDQVMVTPKGIAHLAEVFSQKPIDAPPATHAASQAGLF